MRILQRLALKFKYEDVRSLSQVSVSVARVFVLPNCSARWLNAGGPWVITLLFISTTVLVVSQRGRPPSQQLLFSESILSQSSGLLVNEEKSHWVPM